MNILQGFSQSVAYQGSFLSIGNFDGVHRGHQAILGELVTRARRLSVPAVVMTFDPHPVAVLAPERVPPQLTTLDHKLHIISDLGVDAAIVCEATHDLLALSAEEFFRTCLLDTLQFRGVVEGANFCFGRGREGTVARLTELCRQAGRECHIVSPILVDGESVSSSMIRQLLAHGEVSRAARMLGRPHRNRGRVVSGAGRGRSIGVPTANVSDVETMLPGEGVYAARCQLDGHSLPAAVHLGGNPTFDDPQTKLEVHLLDFQEDLYGRELEIDYLERVRGIQTFASLDQLRSQLQHDLRVVRELLQGHP